jgi:hypothetical protein
MWGEVGGREKYFLLPMQEIEVRLKITVLISSLILSKLEEYMWS